MKPLFAVAALTWAGLWWTADQQGQRLFDAGRFREAAEAFVDPMWQGAAWYRAGEFERAARAFARRDSAAAWFDQGNARLMQGKYDAAITCYDRALELRAGWAAAVENRAIAAARKAALDVPGGIATEGQLEPDEIVFDADERGGESAETEVAGGAPMSAAEIQALWLRRVNTRPADFLKAKFAFQQRTQGQERPR